MPLDLTSPEKIAFLVESYEKEARLNQRWVQKNLDKLKECAKLENPKNYTVIDVQKKRMILELPQLTTSHGTSNVNRRSIPVSDLSQICTKKVESSLRLPTGGEGPIYEMLPPIMKPVDSEDLELLKDNKGRQTYLKKRYKMEPENKFNEQVCTGWTHGWGFSSSYFGRPAPKYGRRAFLLKAAKSRSGPAPDPIYYKDLYNITASKCAKTL